MAFRTRHLWVLLVIAILAAIVVAPTLAFAADSLSWALSRYAGPPDLPDYPNDPITVPSGLNAVSFADASRGWAAGACVKSGSIRSLVAYTDNGGASWTDAPLAAAGELSGVFARGSAVWAVGASGIVVRYDGVSWTAKKAVSTWPDGKALRAVAFVDDMHGWAVGDGLGVIATNDGGVSWSSVAAPSTTGTAAYRAIAVVDPATVIAVGDGGRVRRLSLGGLSVLAPVSSSDLYAIAFSDSTHGFAVGSGRTLVRTSDSGLTWTQAQLLPPSWSLSQPRAISFADAMSGMVVGTYQTVWRTTDGGDTWVASHVGESNGIYTGDGQEYTGVALPGGSPGSPVVVGRGFRQLVTDPMIGRAFVLNGRWTGLTLPPPAAPAGVAAADGGSPGPRILVTWTDASSNEDGYVVEHAQGSTGEAAFSRVATLGANRVAYSDGVVDWDSTWYYRVRAYRGDEAVSAWTYSSGFRVDTTPPETVSDAFESYVDSAVITLSATDGGSGVATTHFRVDGERGGPERVGTTVSVTAPGPHTLEFWSVDPAGNAETPHAASFSITTLVRADATPPVTTSDAVASYEGTAVITLSAKDEDGGAGVAATYFRLRDAPPAWVRGHVVLVTVPGAYTVEFWSEDAARNQETLHEVTFVVTPRVAPTTIAKVASVYATSARISLTATDIAGSGVAVTYYRLDGGLPFPASTVNVTRTGTHTLAFWSVDRAGVIESPRTATFTVITPPSSKGTPSTPSVPAVVKRGVAFTSYGYVTRHKAGTSPVRLYFYRYRSGHWVYYKWTYAKVSTVLTFSKYSDSTSVPYTGRWRVRARHTVSGVNRYSAYREFSAK